MVKTKIIAGILILALMVIIILELGLTGFVINGDKDTINTIKIGAVISLSGKAAPFGEMIRTGADMAVEEINEEGKINLKIIYEDTGGDDTKAVTSAKKLINVDNVNIIIGAAKSSSTLAMAPVTEKEKVILFTPISGSEDITNAGDYVFRNREGAVANGKAMAIFLKDQQITNVAVLVAQSPNSLTYSENFIKEFENLGGKIVFSTEYLPEEVDFKTEIMKIKNSKAEAVYLATSVGVDGIVIVKQLVELGFEGLVTGSNALESEDFLIGAGDAAEGVLLTSPKFDIENPEIQDYRIKYNSLYGKDSSPYAANSYDAVYILKDAIISCGGDDDTACIRDYIYGIKDYFGISGITTFNEDGDVIKPISIKVVRNGEFVLYE